MIRVADLFCGAGGASTGFLQAATKRNVSVDLVAVNHWPTAVETHTRNHTSARHFCQSIETLDPEVAVPGGKLDLLIAAPECVHFSTARGGRPMCDQSRASAWHLVRWLEVLRVDHLLIENVPEFLTWGPLGATGRPIQSKRGQTFHAFVGVLESLNYRVEWRILNAADYGAVTTRRRLFLQARRGRKAIIWPKQTHSRKGGADLFGGLKKWRAAREVIDWTLPSESIFTRKRPLKPATVRRIIEGLKRFGGPALQPFLVVLRNHMDGQSIDGPVPALVAGGSHVGRAQPCVVKLTHGDRSRARSAGEPLPTITAANRGELGVVEPFIVPYHAERDGQSPRTHDVNAPLPVVPTSPVFALVEPFVLGQQSGSIPRSVDQPVPTLAADGAVSLTEAFLTQHYGSGDGIASVDAPVPTVTTRDRFALVQPTIDGLTLDIRFRMLQPHELSAAMSFPQGYQFAGNKGEQIKQVGNAIDVSMAKALGLAILDAMKHTEKQTKVTKVVA